MSNSKEYIVTLHKFEDLEDFYNDMESAGGGLYIPNRNVEVFLRRPISKNTHYMLTDEEATILRNDSRVLAVTLNPKDAGVSARPVWVQNSNNWSKSFFNNPNDANWGILRCYEGVNRANWGYDATENQSGEVNINASGKNVDIVIVDGHIDPEHPEFAVNVNGTGGSRVVQYNWFQHTSAVTGGGEPNGTYVYSPYIGVDADSDSGNNHGTHVAGIAAGNTVGWARDANIYNICPYDYNTNFSSGVLDVTLIYDYIAYWHTHKPINPKTGQRNPTIINNSWASSIYLNSYEAISNITYRGVTYDGPFTIEDLKNYGIENIQEDGSFIVEYLSPYLSTDVESGFIIGLISVGAAGNESYKIDNPYGNSPDYDNLITYVYNVLGVPISENIPYNRGATPGAAQGSICVGAIGAKTSNPPGADAKADFSNTGPRINIWAPGDLISSAVLSAIAGTEDGYDTPVADNRNNYYYKTKISGTSMACPQVTGLLSCFLEADIRSNLDELDTFIKKTSTYNQIPNIDGGPSELYNLQNAPNRYLAYKEQRPSKGVSYPKLNLKARPTTGQVWPRPNIFRYGTQ